MSSSNKELTIRDTMFDDTYADKIDKEDLVYYDISWIKKDKKYQSLIAYFVPDEDDIWAFRGTKKQARLIFPSHEGYTDDENEKYEEFQKYLKDNDIKFPEWITKRHTIRALDGENYKYDVTAKRMGEIIEFKKETFPFILNDNQKTLLDVGLLYVHGRDTSLRPMMVFNPKVILDYEIGLEDSLPCCVYIAYYIVEHMLTVGTVENWVNVLDLAHLSFNSLPKKWIIEFIKKFSSILYARTKTMYLLN